MEAPMQSQVSSPVARFTVSIVLLLGLIILVSTILERTELSTPIRVGLAILPVVAYVFCLWSYLGLVRQADELQRRIHLEALAIAFPSSAVAIFAAEYLRKAGIIAQFKPDYALMIMLALWGIGILVAWRRYV
jgi:hypothetical protein